MSKISTRFREITLPQGDQEATLAALRAEIVAEIASEESGGSRFGSKSKAAAKAVEYDKLAKKAESDAVRITVYALAYDEFTGLQDLHPPRKGDALDSRTGYNRKTFPHALLKASLVRPAEDGPTLALDELITQGEAAFAELGRLSHLHYARLENGAWDVNVGDDSLPKFSAVSLLKQAREPDSKPQHDSE